MTKLFTAVTLFLICFLGIAQNQDFPSPGDGVMMEPHPQSNATTNEKSINYIPLKFHLVVDNSSWFNDTTHLDSLLIIINEKFLPADIQFYKCTGVNIIHDAQLANDQTPHTVISNLHPTHGVSNLINFYIANSTTQYGGYSFSGPNGATGYNVQHNGVVIDGSKYLYGDKALPPHELGHYFGLYHPASSPANLELVDGSNCQTAGDYCCDTPAEYGGMCCASLPNCVFNPAFGIVTDSNGDTLNPDVNNIMSNMQYNTSCREVFTNDQYDRIRYYYDNYLTHLECPSQASLSELNTIHFTLVPNPAKESVTISVPHNISSYQISMYNLTGKKVFQSKELYTPQYNLNTLELKTGTYIIELRSIVGSSKSILVIE